jgi:hypothetical protein
MRLAIEVLKNEIVFSPFAFANQIVRPDRLYTPPQHSPLKAPVFRPVAKANACGGPG